MGSIGPMVKKLQEQPWCGTQRIGMKTNCLLVKPELGKARKTIFVKDDPQRVFGMTNLLDSEGAREVTMIWKEHKANPDAKPGPDFKAMNKLAAVRGLTIAKQYPEFRAKNALSLRTGKRLKKAYLASDLDKSTTYGTPSVHRTAEQIRAAGPDEPPIQHVVQGAYQFEWVQKNSVKAAKLGPKRSTVSTAPTRASLGHTFGAQQHIKIWSETPKDAGFKLSKFKKIPAKVTRHNGGFRDMCACSKENFESDTNLVESSYPQEGGEMKQEAENDHGPVPTPHVSEKKSENALHTTHQPAP